MFIWSFTEGLLMTLGLELDSHHMGTEHLTCGWRRAVILLVLCGAGVCAMQVPLLAPHCPLCPPPVAQLPDLSGPWSVTFGFPMWLSGKESVSHWKRCKRRGFDSWVRRIPGGGNGNLLQYSCLENSVGRGDWPWGPRQLDMTWRLSRPAVTVRATLSS